MAGDDESDVFVGVPSAYNDLYGTIVFLGALFLLGDVVCQKCLRIVPSLVGHIVVGMVLGPEGFDWIQPSPEQWVLLGNLGLLLLIVQAGLEMDIQVLRLVGLRGVVIAVVGSVLPISIGTGLVAATMPSLAFKNALAAGCSFGPTSAGIAMNVLGQCGVLQRPVGQLIVAAAIVDDILALVVLSQLRALTGETTAVADIVLPIVSAVSWLVLGGTIALVVFPKLYNPTLTYVLSNSRLEENKREQVAPYVSLACLLVMLLGLLPATFYTEASYLLGAFLSGLAFCQDEGGLNALFARQFKRLIQWLLKVFFAATIGFQVPFRSFSSWDVIGRGLVLVAALTGKLAVGFLAPNLETQRQQREGPGRFRGRHLRDCFVVGFSMMGEAEFAFVVAVFGLTEGLIPSNLYASIVLAILLSTVISPLLLRSTLALFPYDDDEEEKEEKKKAADDDKERPAEEPMETHSGGDAVDDERGA